MNIEGWIPTQLEKGLMDGSFEEYAKHVTLPEIADDLLEVMEFNEAMQELKRDIMKLDNN